MAKNSKWVHTLRNTLLLLSTMLMIAVVVFQSLEIKYYEIWPHIKATIIELFHPEAASTPTQPSQSSAPTAEQSSDAPAGEQQTPDMN